MLKQLLIGYVFHVLVKERIFGSETNHQTIFGTKQ